MPGARHPAYRAVVFAPPLLEDVAVAPEAAHLASGDQ